KAAPDDAATAAAPAARRSPRTEKQPQFFGALPQDLPRDDFEQTNADEGDRGPARALSRGGEQPAAAVWWPGLLWLVGTGLLLTRLLIGRGLLVLLRRRCAALTAGPIVERVQAIAPRLGIRRAISIRQARGSLGPATFGVWRPTLVLPKDFATDFEPAAQEAILA